MSLHSLLSVTIGVPNVGETAAYYADFGLTPADDGWFSTADAGRQLRLLPSPVRRLLELRVGADDADDLARATAGLAALGVPSEQNGTSLSTSEPVTGTRVVLDVAPRTRQGAIPATPYNGPGRLDRPDTRAPGFTRPDRVRPRKLGHAVLGSTDYAASTAFFTEGLGFKVSDRIKGVGAFMRCSTDHHNVLVLAAPVSFLHHTSWQVDDVRRRRPRGAGDARGQARTARVGPRPALRGLELLLVPQGPGGQLLRVLQRHGLHHRRPALDPGGSGGGAGAIRLGPAAAPLLPASRGPRGHDDRSPLDPLNGAR